MKVSALFVHRLFVVWVLLTASATATASADLLRDYLWTHRVLVTFSADESVPERLILLKQIEQHPCEFRRRDLVHIDLIAGSADYQSLGQRFSVSSKDFRLVLIGKDGKTKLSANAAELADIFVLIDTMPMRKKEMRGERCQ